jgi:hypothetical protein
MVFITGTPYDWSALPTEAHAHQARALAEYRRFADTLGVLIREIPDDRLAKFRDDTALVTRFISREAASYKAPERVLDKAVGALRPRCLGWIYEPGRSTLGLGHRGDAVNPHASVVVVTRDVFFQNKLEFARVPFVSPEDLGIEEYR